MSDIEIRAMEKKDREKVENITSIIFNWDISISETIIERIFIAERDCDMVGVALCWIENPQDDYAIVDLYAIDKDVNGVITQKLIEQSEKWALQYNRYNIHIRGCVM